MGTRAVTLIGLGLGFAVGALVGFAWGQGTRAAASNNVATYSKDGKLVVEVDYVQAAKEGLMTAIQTYR